MVRRRAGLISYKYKDAWSRDANVASRIAKPRTARAASAWSSWTSEALATRTDSVRLAHPQCTPTWLFAPCV